MKNDISWPEILACLFWAAVAFVGFRCWKPEWGGEWFPYVGAGVVFILALGAIVTNWTEEQQKEQERQDAIAIAKYDIEMKYRRRRKRRQPPPETPAVQPDDEEWRKRWSIKE